MTALAPSGRAIDLAVGDLALALDDGAVQTDDASLRAYADPYSYDGRDTFLPSAVVLPTSVEQVQSIVRVARERQVPLWTVSQGRNNGYGGPAPRVGGSIVVSLRDMNRVLAIDAELAHALVEPGVRFFDLDAAVRAGGHELTISVPELGWGSVIGNTLEHGVGYTVYGDHAASHCGMEVVLSDGSLLRTGMGAMEGNRSWQCYPRGFGPTADGIFMQSNFGIVTKMGVWLMPRPECYLSCGVQVEREGDLYPLIDVLRQLMLDRTIENVPVIANALTAAAAVTPRAQWWEGDGIVPDEVVERICRETASGAGRCASRCTAPKRSWTRSARSASRRSRRSRARGSCRPGTPATRIPPRSRGTTRSRPACRTSTCCRRSSGAASTAGTSASPPSARSPGATCAA